MDTANVMDTGGGWADVGNERLPAPTHARALGWGKVIRMRTCAKKLGLIRGSWQLEVLHVLVGQAVLLRHGRSGL